MAGLLLALIIAAPARAQLTGRPAVFDLGRQEQAKTVRARYVIRNDGQETASIRAVRVSCLCARTEKAPRTLAPGESAELIVLLETGSFEGPVRKKIMVDWGPGSRVLELEFLVDVVPSWSVSATEIHLGGARPGAILETTVLADLAPGRSPQLRLGAIPAGLEAILESIAGEPNRRRIRLRWEIPADARPGPRLMVLPLLSDDPAKPAVDLRLDAFVEGDLVVKPRSLSLGLHERSAEKRVRLVLESRSGRDFRLRRVQENLFLLFECDLDKAAAQQVIEVVLPRGLPVGTQKGLVRIETDHEEAPLIEIPYVFRVVDR